MKFVNRAGSEILAWDDWTRPKKDYQWAEGRSAMELAKAWFRGRTLECPQELAALLQQAPFIRNLELLTGRPELVTPLPMPGEGRNHDLHLLGTSATGFVTI